MRRVPNLKNAMYDEKSAVEDEYHKRVDDLAGLLSEIVEIYDRVDEANQAEPHADEWYDIVDAVENHIGPIGFPPAPREITDWESVLVHAPAYQGDHVEVAIQWDTNGLNMVCAVLHFVRQERVLINGPVADLDDEVIEEFCERAKAISPQESLDAA